MDRYKDHPSQSNYSQFDPADTRLLEAQNAQQAMMDQSKITIQDQNVVTAEDQQLETSGQVELSANNPMQIKEV